MSFPVSLKLQIEGDAQVQSKIKALNQEMTGLGKGAGQAAGPLNDVNKSMSNVSKGSQDATKNFVGYNKSVTDVGKSSTKTEKANTGLGKSIGNAAGGFALAGSAAISLWNAYDNVGDASARVEIAHGRVATAEKRLSTTREALTKLQTSGTASALDLEQAQLAVTAAEAGMVRANLGLTNSQEALNEAWLNAATSIIPAVFTGITGISSIIQAFTRNAGTATQATTATATSMTRLGGAATSTGAPIRVMATNTELASTAQTRLTSTSATSAAGITRVGAAAATSATPLGRMATATTAASVAQVQFTRTSATALGSIAGIGTATTAAATGAMPKFVGGMRAMGVAVKGFLISLGPIGLILIGVGIAMTAIATNAFGFRDAIQSTGKAIGDFLPFLRPLLEGLEGIGKMIGLVPDDAAAASAGMEEFTEAELGATGGSTVLAGAVKKVNDEIGNLSPIVRGTAFAWGLFNNAAVETDPILRRQLDYLKKLDQSLEPVRQQVLDLAVANGVDLKDALAMTDEQMIEFIATSENLGPTLEMQAAEAAAAAKKFAEAWMTSFEQVSAAQREFASSMRSAMGTMGQELGEEMEVGLSDLEKKVSKGLVGFSDQFFEEIFPEDFLANAIIEGNDPGDIADELKDLMDDVVDEDIITKQQAKDMLKPMIDYFDQDLPADVEAPLAYMAGQLPHMIEDWKPAIVNGVVAVGAAGKQAIDNHIIKPFQAGLAGLESGASGLDFGTAFLTNIRNSLPAIESEAGPEIAELIQGLLDTKNMGLDEKVQGIIDILDQIRPGFKDTIMGMDRDADGIADIMDKKVLTPVDQMRVGILEAFRDFAQAAQNFDLAEAIGQQIFEVTGNIEDLGEQTGLTATEIYELDRAAREGRSSLSPLGDDALTAAGNIKAVETAIDSLMETARQAQEDEDAAWFLKQDLAAGAAGGGGPAPVVVPAPDTSIAQQGWTDLLNFINGITTGINNLVKGRMQTTSQDLIPNQSIAQQGWNQLQQHINGITLGIENLVKGRMQTTSTNLAPNQSIAQQGWSELQQHINGITLGIENLVKARMQTTNTSLAPDKSLAQQGWNELQQHINGITLGIENLVKGRMATTSTSLAPDKSIAEQGWSDIQNFINGITTGIENLVKGRMATTSTNLKPDKSIAEQGWNEFVSMVYGKMGEIVSVVQGRSAQIAQAITDALKLDERDMTEVAPDESLVDKFIIPEVWKGAGSKGALFFVGGFAEDYAAEMRKTDEEVMAEFSAHQREAWNKIGQDIAGQNWGDMFIGLIEAGEAAIGPDGTLITTAESGFNKMPPMSQAAMNSIASILANMDPSTFKKNFEALHGVTQTSMNNVVGAVGEGMNAAILKVKDGLATIQGALGRGFTLPGGGAGVATAAFQPGATGGATGGVTLPGGAGGGAGGAPPVPDFSAHITAWTNFATQVGAQVNAIGQHLIRMVTGYQTTANQMLVAFSNMTANWTIHAAAVGTQVNTTGQHLIRLVAGYQQMANAILTAFNNMVANWSGHASQVSAQVNATGQNLTRLVAGYQQMANAILTAFNNMIANWRNHASAVSSVVNTIGGSHLQRLAAGYQALANAVNRALQNANANWARHRSAVASAVSSSVSAVSRLASATSSAMNRVASAMRTATSAANSLRSAISRLQSRTITVTTRYRTIGSPAGGVRRAAKGFDGIVTQPTTFLTGEGGRPEHVQVTPLSPNASGNVKMNRAAATSGLRAQFGGPIAGKPMVRAGGSKSNASQRADSVVIMPGGKIMIFTAGGTLREAPWFKKGSNFLDWLGKSKKQLNKLKGLSGSEVLKPTMPKGRIHTTKDPFRDAPISTFDVTGSRTLSRIDPLRRNAGSPGAIRGRGGKSLFDLRASMDGGLSPVARRHGEKMQAWVVKEQRFADGSYIRQFNNGAIVFGKDVHKTPEAGASATASKKSPTGSFIRVFSDGTWRKFDRNGRTIKSGKHKFTGSKYEYRGDQLYKSGKQFTPKINARQGFSGMVSRPTSFMVGEGGRPEYVNVQPTGGGGGRGGGRPIMVQQYISLEVDKKVIAKAIRSEMLGGIYSMA